MNCHSRCHLIAVSVILLCLAAAATADDAPSAYGAASDTDAFDRPKLNPVLPYREDWSALRGRDRSSTGDPFDPIKFIPLTDDESIWASFGGQLRLRYEHFENFGFGPANDDGYLLTRLRMHGELNVGEAIRFFVEGKSAFSTDRDLPGGRRTLDVDELALQNLFVDIRLPVGDVAVVTLRPGRQELAFGRQRLVSPLDWANTRRTWDGVSAAVEVGDWTITPFFAQFARVQKYDFNDPDAQTLMYGAYATGATPVEGMRADAYLLVLERGDVVTFNGTSGTEDRYTFGGRLFGKCGTSGFDYDVEGAWQLGSVGAADVSAYMIGSEIGYTLADMATSPRLFLGLDYASGDNAAGGDVQTFNQLFPLGHAYLGWIDTIGRQNILDVAPGVSIRPIPKLTVTCQAHLFWRADTSDAVYNAGGGVVLPGAAASDRYVGTEIDLVAKYQLDPHATLFAGYSHFFTGDFLDRGAPAASDDIDFLYAIFQYTF